MMSRTFVVAPCPHLPMAHEKMDYRVLEGFGSRRDGEFFHAALCYGQHLWCCGHAGRALLALTRALYAELDGTEEILKEHPLPYRAMSWILQHHSSDDFPGNPRLSYQHQAMRIRGHRKEIRQARAWAVWALVSQIRPHLPGDTTMKELSLDEIAVSLETFGLPQECELWRSCLDVARSYTPRQEIW